MTEGGCAVVHDALVLCLRHFAHKDESNAATHGGKVRYSPVTFLVARALESSTPTVRASHGVDDGRDWLNTADTALLESVLSHDGSYEEDTGR